MNTKYILNITQEFAEHPLQNCEPYLEHILESDINEVILELKEVKSVPFLFSGFVLYLCELFSAAKQVKTIIIRNPNQQFIDQTKVLLQNKIMVEYDG